MTDRILPESEWPERAPASAQLEGMILAAAREPARNRMDYWAHALEEHRTHRSFRTQGWAFTREVGFTCECCGHEQEWRISITGLRERLPEMRDAWERFRRLQRQDIFRGASQRKREQRRANRRAKALLHRHLTKEQRWELRATKSLTVTGQDGRTYQITEGTCNNVLLLEDGRPRFRLCAVAKLDGFKQLPVYDLMLAQKLVIENDVAAFLSVANAVNLETGHFFKGLALLGEASDPPREEAPEPSRRIRDRVPDEAIDDPRSWATAQLREAESHRREHGYADADERPPRGRDRGDCPHGSGRGLQALLGQG